MTEKPIIDGLKKIFPGRRAIRRFVPGKYSPAGIPDVLLCFERQSYWIEIKINKQILTAPQKEFLADFAKAILLRIDTKNATVIANHNGLIPKELEILALHLTKKTGVSWKFKEELFYFDKKH